MTGNDSISPVLQRALEAVTHMDPLDNLRAACVQAIIDAQTPQDPQASPEARGLHAVDAVLATIDRLGYAVTADHGRPGATALSSSLSSR